MNERIRVLLADDHRIVLGGLLEVFRLEDDLEVVATCTDGATALDQIVRLQPDVAVVDVSMPGLDGISIAREIRRREIPTRIVILTAVIDDDQAVEIFRIGVEGVVLKEMPPHLLLECVRSVHQGKRWIEKESLSRAAARILHREDAQQSGSPLTRREVEILRMVADGLRSREIADKLFVSEGTIKFHLHNVYEKLGVRGRVEVINEARRRHLI